MFTDIEAQFVDYVNVDASDVSIKESLSSILSWAEDYIFRVYGVSIIERTLTETINGTGTSKLFTNKGDIASISSLIVSDETVDTSLLKFSKNTIFYKDNTFASGTFNVDIVYKVGYATSDLVPKGLINALFVIGRKMYTDETKNFDAYASISSDIKQSVKLIDSIPTLADNLLQAYRIFRL